MAESESPPSAGTITSVTSCVVARRHMQGANLVAMRERVCMCFLFSASLLFQSTCASQPYSVLTYMYVYRRCGCYGNRKHPKGDSI